MVTDSVPHAGRPPQSSACVPGSALLEGRDERPASHFSRALAVLSYTVLVMGIVVSIWAVTSWLWTRSGSGPGSPFRPPAF